MTHDSPVSPEVPEPVLGYASPTPLAEAGDAFRHVALLVARDGCTLPARCILCGGEGVHRPIGLQFTWDASFTMTRTSTLQLRQKGTVKAYLCAVHRGRWMMGRVVGIVGISLGLALMAVGMTVSVVSESSDVPLYTPEGIGVTVAGFAVMILSLFFFTFRTRTLSCERIEGGYMYLEGASEVFLGGLPALPQSARSAS